MRVLIASVPAGSGHVRAAEAILEAFHQSAPDIEAVHVQVTDLTKAGFRRFYVDGYRLTVNHAPSLWGRVYRFWDNREPDSGLTPLLHGAQRLCAGAFYDYLDQFRPDTIITTHFLVQQLLAARRKDGYRPVLESVITDYDVHRFWVSDTVSRYYVAHEDMAASLARYGVPPSRVVASGIPVHPCFSAPVSPSSVFNSLHLHPQRPVVLVLTGGLGLTQFGKAVEQLLALPEETQIVTVSGKNETLRAGLDAIKPPPHITLKNLGFVNNMHELLTISDVVITKPGGLTVSECLAKKKLMVLFSPIPGQEEKNAEFLTARDAALQVNKLEELVPTVTRLLSDRNLRARMLLNVKHCARPHAAYAIAQTTIQSCNMAA